MGYAIINTIALVSVSIVVGLVSLAYYNLDGDERTAAPQIFGFKPTAQVVVEVGGAEVEVDIEFSASLLRLSGSTANFFCSIREPNRRFRKSLSFHKMVTPNTSVILFSYLTRVENQVTDAARYKTLATDEGLMLRITNVNLDDSGNYRCGIQELTTNDECSLGNMALVVMNLMTIKSLRGEDYVYKIGEPFKYMFTFKTVNAPLYPKKFPRECCGDCVVEEEELQMHPKDRSSSVLDGVLEFLWDCSTPVTTVLFDNCNNVLMTGVKGEVLEEATCCTLNLTYVNSDTRGIYRNSVIFDGFNIKAGARARPHECV